MGAGDAIHAGFADHYVPGGWEALKTALCVTGDVAAVQAAAAPPPPAPLARDQALIDALFGGATLADIWHALAEDTGELATAARGTIARNAPLSMACAVDILHRLGDIPTMTDALDLEYRFTFRALEHSDFVEGIRAQIIDKDKTPHWRHPAPDAVPPADVAAMLIPLGPYALTL
jgi:enoyl-CoA hydratase